MARASSRRSHNAPGHRWGNGRVSRGIRSGAVHGDFSPRPLATVVPGPGDGLGLRVKRYLEGKVQILGVSVEPAEEGKKLLERVTRDCEEDRPHIPLVRLLCDPDAKLIRAVGTENEGHPAGLIVKWAYVSVGAGRGNDSVMKHRRNSCHG